MVTVDCREDEQIASDCNGGGKERFEGYLCQVDGRSFPFQAIKERGKTLLEAVPAREFNGLK